MPRFPARLWLLAAALPVGVALLVVGLAAMAPAKPKDTEKDWEAGRALFVRNCVTCHGPDGRGDTDEGKRLAIVNLTTVLPKRTDDQIRNTIVNGAIGMRGYDFAALEIDRLLEFLRTMGDIGAGYAVFKQRCITCHGPDGTASTPMGRNIKAADLTKVVPKRTDAQLTTVIRDGKGRMPAWRAVLTGNERAQVLRYIKTLPPPKPPPQ